MKCPNCGAEVSTEDVRCPECYIHIEKAIKLKGETMDKIFEAEMGTSKEVAKINQQTEIIKADGKKDKIERDSENQAKMDNARTNTEVVKIGAEGTIAASDAKTHEELNNLEVIDKNNRVTHTRAMQEIAEKQAKRDAGIPDEENSLTDDDVKNFFSHGN